MRRVLLVGAAGGLGAGLLYAAYRLYNAPAAEPATQDAPAAAAESTAAPS